MFLYLFGLKLMGLQQIEDCARVVQRRILKPLLDKISLFESQNQIHQHSADFALSLQHFVNYLLVA